MPRAPHSAQERAEIRARILDAAWSLFTETGFDGLSMRAVAARAGMSAGAIYRYFPAKSDLAVALWQEGARGLEDRLRHIVAGAGDPVEALRALAQAYADFALEDPAMFRMLFFADGGHEFDVGGATSAFTSYYLARECVERAIAQGRFAVTDADLATQTLWAAIHGVISLRMICVDFPFCEPRRLIAQAIATVLAGLQEAKECGAISG